MPAIPPADSVGHQMVNNKANGKPTIPSGGTSYIYLAVAVASVGGMLFGYDTGWVSGAILFIHQQFALTAGEESIVVSGALVGAMLSSVVGGASSDKFGRRHLLLVAAGICVLGPVTTALANNLLVLIIGRFITGIGIGLASFTTPLYISEIAPERDRGRMVSLNQVALTGGIIVAYVVDLAFSASGQWRWMVGLAVVPAILLGAGMAFLPNSPRWLASKGQDEQAKETLQKIRGTHDVEAEYQAIQAGIAEEKGSRWAAVFSAGVRPALIVGLSLAVFQQVTGINTIIYYAPTIMRFAGLSSATAAILATAGVGIVNVVVTIVAIFLIDKVGRRPLLLGGMGAMLLGLVVLCLAFALTGLRSELSGITIASLVIYVAGFAIGLGPIFWLLISEIFPTKIRGKATGLATTVNWGANLLVSVTFLSLIDALGKAAVFGSYGVLTVAAIVFAYFRVPETKGKTLEQIQGLWHAGTDRTDPGLSP